MSNSTRASVSATNINPVVERYLCNPLTFKPGKQLISNSTSSTSSASAERPASYIVLSKGKNQRSTQHNADDEASKGVTSPSKPKPRSMAEAVAAYTGKKFLTKREKKLENKQKKDALMLQNQQSQDSTGPEQDDMGEDVTQDNVSASKTSESENDSNYESASEYLETSFENTATGTQKNDELEESANDTILNGEVLAAENPDDEQDDEDDEDDEDFDEESAIVEENDESACDSDNTSSPADTLDEDEDLEKLRTDLRTDTLEHEVQHEEDEEEGAEVEAEKVNGKIESDAVISPTTPPTTPEENDAAAPKVEPQNAESVVASQFYKMNEIADDRGANNSTRIYKNWRELSKKKPVGLLNHGVICYMNSAIQSLIHIPALQHYLNEVYAGKHNDVLKPRSVSLALAELSKRMWETSSAGGNKSKQMKYINPKKIVQRLGDINCMMSEWQQEDSHEYLMSLMSRLQEDSTPKGVKLNESILYDIFGGLLDQRITCTKCKNVSETKQEFYDLTLGLNKKKQKTQTGGGSEESKLGEVHLGEPQQSVPRYSIEKSIRDFFSNELIKTDRADKSSGYYCESCKERTNANKISFINRSPETLVIHLKRFKFDGNSSSKMKQPIAYSKYLDLSEYQLDKTGTKYQLISCIVHEGRSVSSGHYVAHCLQPDGSWATYDDEYINKIDEREVLNDPSAYVLVYTRLAPKNTKRSHEQSEQSDVTIGNNSTKHKKKKRNI